MQANIPININDYSAKETIDIIYNETKRLGAILCWVDTAWIPKEARLTYHHYNNELTSSPTINKDTTDQVFVDRCAKIAIKHKMPLLVLNSDFWGIRFFCLYYDDKTLRPIDENNLES